MPQNLRIGDLLVQQKLITNEQLEKAIKEQREFGKKLGSILIQSGAINEKTFLQFLAQQTNLPFIELTHYPLNKPLSLLLPENYARYFQAILLTEDQGQYLIGMVDPLDIFATDELYTILKKPLKVAIVSETELLYILDQLYRRTEEITGFAGKLASELQTSEKVKKEESMLQSDPAVLKLINSMFEDAVQINASDIHIEPAENILRIRQRVDGLLQEQAIPIADNKSIPMAVAQRLKLMAGLDIAEKRLPQDGHLDITVRDAKIDIRLSTMPGQFGETVVMRLLNKTSKILDLESSGMSKTMLERFRQLIKSPYGMILITGPTGSGKTTTLYGALSEINDVTKNIITIEDPVEYQLVGINQIQVNAQIGLTFARVLRSILRQDPNIILVGEIRDQETAAIALRAALTGHLVFSTLHTNDATSTATRLIDIGIESYLVASTIRAILAQRLVRRICTNCAVPYKPTDEENNIGAALFSDAIKHGNFSHSAGCTYCNFTGFKGRIGVFELLELDGQMREALRTKDNKEFVQTVAKNRTTPTLLANTLELAKQGVVALSEVIRIVGEQI